MKLKLSDIRPAATALRDVEKQSAKFIELVKSVAECGILTAISVREATDPETGEQYHQLIDGRHRYTAACEAGLEEIPVVVIDATDEQSLIYQMHANFNKIETKPAAYSNQLRRILEDQPQMTHAELAGKVGMSLKFITDRLSLGKIKNEETLALIDNGKICIQNAIMLAALPEAEQDAMVQSAIEETAATFAPMVKELKKKINEATRKGRAEITEFPGATPRLRSMKDIKALAEDAAPIKIKPDATIAEAVAAVIDYILNLDPESQEAAKTKWEANQARREEQKVKRAKDRETKKLLGKKERADKARLDADKALAELTGEATQPAE